MTGTARRITTSIAPAILAGQVFFFGNAVASEDLHERWADPRRIEADVLKHINSSPNATDVSDRSIAIYCKQETDFHQIYGKQITYGSNRLDSTAPYYKVAVFEQGHALQADGRVDSGALSITVEKVYADISDTTQTVKIKVRLCATNGYPLPTNFSVSVYDRGSGEFVTRGRVVYPITFVGAFANPIDVDGLEVDGVAIFREGLDRLLREIVGEEGGHD